MLTQELFSDGFEEWEYDIYSSKGQFIISTYERNRETDKDLLNFIKKYHKRKVLKFLPTEVRGFAAVVLDIGDINKC